MKLKIIVPAIGSRGDVQPYISLCQGLIAAGHSPVLATNPTLMPLAQAHQIPSVPVGKPVDMGAVGAEIMAKSGKNWWIGMIRTMQLGFQLVQDAYADLMKAIPGADLVITSDTFAGATESEKLGVPWISVTLQPTRVPVPNPNVSAMMKLFFPLANGVIMAPINKFRKKVGMPPLQDMGRMLSQRMVLIPVSPSVFPANPLWPDHVHLTGYWFARPVENWSPPQDLVDFIRSGEKPVAVSLGAMSLSGEYTRQAAMITLEAIQQAGVRAVIQGWDEALHGLRLPETVFHAGSVPHAWLFSQVRAVVHHGGFGTTASGLRAGVPSIVIPHIIDQLYWGDLVTKLGAGPKYIRRTDLTVPKLTEALRQVRTDTNLQQRAVRIGEAINAEPDGVESAIHWIEQAV